MEIRIMRQEDESQVYSLICSSLDEYFIPETVTYFRMQWGHGQIVATDFTGNIIGYLAGAKLPNGHASIHLFCIAEAYRRKGIGGMMLERFKQAAIMEGYSIIQLEVKEGNSSAYKFYSNKGFVPVERLSQFYNDGSSGIRMICNITTVTDTFSRYS